MTPDNAASMAAVMALFSPWGEVGGLDDRSEQMPSRIWFSRSAQLEVMDHHRHRNVRLAIRGIEGFDPVLITADGPHGVSIGEPAFDGLTLGGETDYVARHQDSIGLRGAIGHGLGDFQSISHGLFNKHMFAGVESTMTASTSRDVHRTSKLGRTLGMPCRSASTLALSVDGFG